MSSRFFVDCPITSGRASLVGSEAHHLAHVMRAGVGAEVVLFDGSGAEFDARVASLARTTVELEILARREVDRELSRDVTLGVCLPKGQRRRWLIEKAVELGVGRVVPLHCERCEARPSDRSLNRLRRTVIDASKQSGRNRLMDVAAATGLHDYVGGAPSDACRLLAHRAGCEETAAADISEIIRRARAVFLAVGPEGGFTEEEVAAAAACGWRIVGLGPRTLRIETAAVALATLAALE